MMFAGSILSLAQPGNQYQRRRAAARGTLVSSSLLNGEAIVNTIPMLIAICVRLQTVWLVPSAIQHCSHTSRDAGHTNQGVQTNSTLGRTGGDFVTPEVRKATHARKFAAQNVKQFD